MEYICLVCEWSDVSRSSAIDNLGRSYELAEGWLFSNGDTLQQLLPEYAKFTYLGFCSRECRYSQEQPVKAANYFRNLPTRISVLANLRSRVINKIVNNSMDNRFYIQTGTGKKYFTTREEATAFYDTDEYLVRLKNNNIQREAYLNSIRLSEIPSTGVDTSNRNEDEDTNEADEPIYYNSGRIFTSPIASISPSIRAYRSEWNLTQEQIERIRNMDIERQSLLDETITVTR